MPTLTEGVKDELGRLPVARPCCRRAEIASMLRLSAAVSRLGGRLAVLADLDEAVAAHRLHDLIAAFGYAVRLQALPAVGPGRPGHYLVSVDGADGEELARRVGLLDGHGRVVRGLPPQVVGGPGCDAAAVWRGAVLSCGRVTWPGHRAPLQVCPPDRVAALALVGVARRLGVSAHIGEARAQLRVVVRDDVQVAALLDRIGAAVGARTWQQSAPPEPALRNVPSRALGSSGESNLERAESAALAATARVHAALAILGADAPAQLLDVGRLRLAHPQARLEQLGARADPPMSKDAVAGRIRRLLARADARAAATGRPATQDAARAADPKDASSAADWPATTLLLPAAPETAQRTSAAPDGPGWRLFES